MALVVGGVTVTGTQTLDASKLTGTASAINGSNITNLPAPSSANVGSATAGLSVGDVGSYAFGKLNSTKSPGDTFSGNNSDYQYGAKTGTQIPSGTWRVMGRTYSGVDTERLTVVLRVS
tara:strand:- start:304 stop:660 length:357 start_codon:yes stop_codon:yes gene_type:complete